MKRLIHYAALRESHSGRQNVSRKTYERAIANWPEDDRPREKLLKYGAHTLSNAEFLAILIRTSVEGASAVDLARELLRKFKTLRAISACDPAELREIKGLSTAKITQIKAAVELGRWMMSEERAFEGPIRSSSDVADYLIPLMRDLKVEMFKVVLLDRRNSVLDVVDIDEGDVAKTQPSIRKIMLRAAQAYAAGLIAVHNHPSGDPTPSEQTISSPATWSSRPGDGYPRIRPHYHR
ncbi:MAG: DNA repair protein RadC [Gammaproteobacteria bacterium]|nr:MAG: DNA repair protein RadC [Gammaproteobacteria bacterium]